VTLPVEEMCREAWGRRWRRTGATGTGATGTDRIDELKNVPNRADSSVPFTILTLRTPLFHLRGEDLAVIL